MIPRRLRRVPPRHPRYILRVGERLTVEQADQIRKAWKAAARRPERMAIITGDVEITDLGR